jgi:hypothetical protein
LRLLHYKMSLGSSQGRGALSAQQVQQQLPLHQVQPGFCLKRIYERLTQGHMQANAAAQPALPEGILLAARLCSKWLRHKSTYDRTVQIGLKKQNNSFYLEEYGCLIRLTASLLRGTSLPGPAQPATRR